MAYYNYGSIIISIVSVGLSGIPKQTTTTTHIVTTSTTVFFPTTTTQTTTDVTDEAPSQTTDFSAAASSMAGEKTIACLVSGSTYTPGCTFSSTTVSIVPGQSTLSSVLVPIPTTTAPITSVRTTSAPSTLRTSTSLITSSPTISITTSSSTPTPSSASSQGMMSSKKPFPVALVASILGVLFFLALLLVAIFFVRRMRGLPMRRRPPPDAGKPPAISESSIGPSPTPRTAPGNRETITVGKLNSLALGPTSAASPTGPHSSASISNFPIPPTMSGAAAMPAYAFQQSIRPVVTTGGRAMDSATTSPNQPMMRSGPTRPVTGRTAATSTSTSEVNDFYAPWVREMMGRGRREVGGDGENGRADENGRVTVDIGGSPTSWSPRGRAY